MLNGEKQLNCFNKAAAAGLTVVCKVFIIFFTRLSLENYVALYLFLFTSLISLPSFTWLFIRRYLGKQNNRFAIALPVIVKHISRAR